MSLTVAVTARAFLNYGQREFERLAAAGCRIGQTDRGPLPHARLLEVLDGADAVVCSTDLYNDAVFEARPQLVLVSRWGAGYGSVDLDACTRHGVLATRVVGCLTDAVADYTFALLLAVARRVAEGDAILRSRGWDELQGASVKGRTLGLAGFGPIGQGVADRARGFHMRVLAHDPFVPAEAFREHGAEACGLDQLLAESDYVSLHAASTPESRGMIGAAALARMKPTAYLINTARGDLLDEPALIAALEAGAIAGAALDTYATEPLPPDAPIRAAPRTLLMPHSAFNTLESALAVCEQACQAVLDVAAGRVPVNLLNPAVLDSPNLRARVA